MKLIKLAKADGSAVWVNPRYIACFEQRGDLTHLRVEGITILAKVDAEDLAVGVEQRLATP